MSISTIVLLIVASLVGNLCRGGDIPFDKFTSNAPLDGEVFLLVNTNSGRCLTDRDGAIEQGVFASAATAQERWKLVQKGDYFALVNEKSGKLLTLTDASRNEGTTLTAAMADEGEGLHQQWHFDKVGNHYALRSPASGLVMAVAEASHADGFRVLQWTWLKGPEQVWMVQWVPGAGRKPGAAPSAQPYARAIAKVNAEIEKFNQDWRVLDKVEQRVARMEISANQEQVVCFDKDGKSFLVLARQQDGSFWGQLRSSAPPPPGARHGSYGIIAELHVDKDLFQPAPDDDAPPRPALPR
jgi:hypothetical protein